VTRRMRSLDHMLVLCWIERAHKITFMYYYKWIWCLCFIGIPWRNMSYLCVGSDPSIIACPNKSLEYEYGFT